MNAPPNKPSSKGMAMIAAYRAERLSQRPVLRSTLHDSHLARRAARTGEQVVGESVQTAIADIAPPLAIDNEPVTIKTASVFAGLVSTAVAEHHNEVSRMRDLETEAMASIHPPAFEDPIDSHADATAPEAETAADTAPQDVNGEPETPPEPPYDPPLAEIGFGPGMLIRLSQLGLHTTRDLAQANAIQLRSELGDISRLVDVDAWIRSARQTSRATAPGPDVQ